LFIL
jgi:hypothetical protein